MSVYPYPGSRGPFSKYTYYEIDRVYGLIRFFSSLTRLRLWNPGYSISDAVLDNGSSLLIVVELLEPTGVKIYSLQKNIRVTVCSLIYNYDWEKPTRP